VATAGSVLTPEFVERGYNNRAAVPEHPQWLARYAEDSRSAREAHRPMLDLRYGIGPKETLDLFVPTARARGTLVFIHGGYWRALDKADFSFVAPPFLARDLAVAVLNYDLCPDATVATIADECRRAVAWLAREGPSTGALSERIVVGGHSAGGHLAVMLYATDWAAYGLPAAPFAGGFTLSGVHELHPLTLSSMNVDLRLDAVEARRLSPVHHAPRTDAPLLVACGADETSEFRRQSQLMFDAWPGNRPQGMNAPLFVAGRHHFSVVCDLAEAHSGLTRAVLALFGGS
jgi:arylformamidase